MPELFDRGGFFVADNATITGDVRLGKGVSVWYGAVVRGDIAPIAVGEMTNIQDLCVLHCDPGKDLIVGKRVTIGHHAMVHAQFVGDDCLIGMGCILLGGAKIGEGCVIGAGAVVRENQEIPPRSIVVGVPGKIIGAVKEEHVADHRERAERYHQLALMHVRSSAS